VAQVRVRSVDANLGYLSLHTAKRRVSIFSCPTACDAFSNPERTRVHGEVTIHSPEPGGARTGHGTRRMEVEQFSPLCVAGSRRSGNRVGIDGARTRKASQRRCGESLSEPRLASKERTRIWATRRDANLGHPSRIQSAGGEHPQPVADPAADLSHVRRALATLRTLARAPCARSSTMSQASTPVSPDDDWAREGHEGNRDIAPVWGHSKGTFFNLQPSLRKVVVVGHSSSYLLPVVGNIEP